MDRFWVGGTGTWNTSSTTNWSATSGGGGGASVPTAADSVFFDQAGTYTVTMTGGLTCLDFTVSAGTVTFSGTGTPTISGSMSLITGTLWPATGFITFNATTTGKTVTTNGVSFAGYIIFNGIGGYWTLGSSLTSTSSTAFQIGGGTFDTGGYALTVFNINLSFAANTRAIKLNNSTVTLTGSGSAVFLSAGSNTLTFDAGTSQINITAAGNIANNSTSPAITLNFYNVAFTSTAAGTRSISGTNTFNNLSVTGPASAGLVTVTFDSRQTINGTLSTTGTAGNRRVFFASATYGISTDLVVNSAPSLTDADFRGLYVRGTAAPISGTRIGNRGECRGITFSTPKTVYWNLAGVQSWTANAWATTPTGTPSTDNFPLPQDTATFTNAGSVTGNISLGAVIGSIDMSGRTSAMTLALSTATVYGNWANGSGTTLTNAVTLTFSGGTTQTITSAGRTFSCGITIDTYGGTVQLADALNIGSQSLTVTNGTFATAGYAVTAGALSSNNSNVRTITLGSSTVSIIQFGVAFGTATNLTFNAGTSTIDLSGVGSGIAVGAGLTFYNVNFSYTASTGTSHSIAASGASCIFNNITVTTAPSAGIKTISIGVNQTITGTLTVAGASAVRRIFLRSDTIGTPRTLTVNAISATDCDFCDINLAGTASGASPTRAGNCGGNTGITFPAPKTVYWNLAGTQNWSATAWATGSGGTPAINNFPLAQDTAVFDNAGSADTVTINAVWNIGTFDASLRTSAMTLTISSSCVTYGDWKFGTGVTSAVTATLEFTKNGTQTITSNGVQFGCSLTINNPFGNVQLADALLLESTKGIVLARGTFDAVTYNVTTGLFSNGSTANTLRMGSGTWTLSGTGAVWNCATAPTLIASTSTIVLSNTSTTTRTFAGGGLYYNKLTIGGTTGISTLLLQGSNTFGELASTKTVAHTILFDSGSTNTFGKWSITGTAGNVVTLNSNAATIAYNFSIAGPANSGIDYLSVRDCLVSATSPGEFYVGANSTNVSNNTRVVFTATPAPRTLYWVGGTGNWSSTTKWDTTSGGGGGAAIPTSLDAVNFNSLSNATAYTATIDAGVTLARCASFTMAGPLTGNVTFAGTVGIAFHGNVSFAATGITRTYNGSMQWAGNSSYTFNTGGNLFSGSAVNVIGIGATWTLANSIFLAGNILTITYGTFDTSTSNYQITTGRLDSANRNIRSILLNGSTIISAALGGTTIQLAITTNLTFNAGTSTFSLQNGLAAISSGGLTFNNVSFTSTSASGITITGANTFNTLSFAGRTSVGITPVTFSADQTISTLTLNAGTASAYRTFLASDTIGTTRTLTVGTLTAGAADIDFRDITIAGAAAPISGTRFGDAKGNSGITFPAAKTVYWALATSNNWGSTGSGSWSATNGGSAAADQFPLAQDTAFIPFARPNNNQTITVNANYNIGTLDMNERNGSALVTLATGTTLSTVYGNWVNGTGTTLTGANLLTFAGRGTQTITSAGRTFTQFISVQSPGGNVLLGDALLCDGSGTSLRVNAGTFNANGYNVTLSSGGFSLSVVSTGSRNVNVGSGTWVLAGSSFIWDATALIGITVTGTGTINLTSASAKTFSGGSISYSGITLNQGGAGTLTISGNNTFKTITNTYSATGATTIALGATTQTLTQPWTATGEAGRVLTISGTSAASPGILRFTGAGQAANVDYLAINNVRAYNLTDTWYAGANSTNGGTLGWYFIAAGGTVYAVTITETGTGTDSITASITLLGSVSETGTGTDSFSAGLAYTGDITESGTVTDEVSARFLFLGAISENATGEDLTAAIMTALGNISETATGTDTDSANLTVTPAVSETATGTDTESARLSANSNISETATATDSVAALARLLAAVSEAATATDLTDSIKGLFAYIVESASITDALNAPGSTYNPSLSETATTTDSISALARFAVQVTESASITDATAAFKAYLAAILEAASGSDAVSPRYIANPAISETATGADTDAAAFTARSSVSETAAGTETVSSLRTLRPSIVETATATDTDSARYSTNPAISEAASGADIPSAAATFQSQVTETSVAQDIVRGFMVAAVQVSESATGSDQISALRALAAAVVETVSGSDAVSAKAVFRGILQEIATLTDSVNAPGSTYSAPVIELATLQDAVRAAATFPTAVIEAATGTEINSAAFTPLVRIVETATITDVASALAAFAARTAESANITDEVSPPGSIYNPVVLAVAQLLDQVSPAGSIYNAPVLESATIADSLIGGFLWNLIDDSQTPDWGDISNIQAVSWVVVADNQTPNWQNVGNTQGTGWTQVNTDDDPDWQLISAP
jgi:hypothetical protein